MCGKEHDGKNSRYCKRCKATYNRVWRQRTKDEKMKAEILIVINHLDNEAQRLADKYGIPRTVNYS